MPFNIGEIVSGFFIPAIVASILAGLLGRIVPIELCRRFAGSIALAAGFVVGYGLLNSGPWLPNEHWHWIPWAIVATGLIGPIGSARGLTWIERLVLYVLLALITAWFLVPTWNDLAPSRLVYVIGYSALIGVIATAFDWIACRTGDRLFLTALFLCATSCSVLMALAGILKFAILGFAFAGPTLGCIFVARGRIESQPEKTSQGSPSAFQSKEAGIAQGIGLVYMTLLVGWAMIGRVQSWSEIPTIAYLLIGCAPISLAFGTIPLIARLSTVKRWSMQLGMTAIPLILGIAIAGLAEMNSGTE